jgi:hypothetical protein
MTFLHSAIGRVSSDMSPAEKKIKLLASSALAEPSQFLDRRNRDASLALLEVPPRVLIRLAALHAHNFRMGVPMAIADLDRTTYDSPRR